jgi:hypothetical protein
MFFNQKNINKKKKLYCLCSDCEIKNFCITEFSCYKAIKSKNCKTDSNDDDYCLGCFSNEIQQLQVILINI